jgi:pimeloyl-ACP methyl ester carboxylesterase
MTMFHEVGTFNDAGVTMSYEIYGTGKRPLVYLHGLLLDSHLNRGLATSLAKAGNRVILLDLPGHGASDKPRRAAAHRMDEYAWRVVHLLDHLEIDAAVVGGVSLGADVALQVAQQAPERLAGMIIEMPVLEQATPFAALLFTPLLTVIHYAAPVVRLVSQLARRVPRERLGPLDGVLAPLLLDPEEIVAVLHGVLVGPVAPTAEQRAQMQMPAMVLGHRADQLHPMGDAKKLALQLPHARLVVANSIFELRVRPARLTKEFELFLDDVWSQRGIQRRVASL